MSVGDKKHFGKALGPKAFPKLFLPPTDKHSRFYLNFCFFFVTDLVSLFVTDFVTDFVNKYFTSISYQIIYVLDTFCVPNFQIPNYNQLGHSTGIIGTYLVSTNIKKRKEPSHFSQITLEFQKTYFLTIFFTKKIWKKKCFGIFPQKTFLAPLWKQGIFFHEGGGELFDNCG